VIGTTVESERLLSRWADDNALTMIKKHQARFNRRPFTWTASQSDYVFRVTARDPKGEVLEGWVRLVGVACFPMWRSAEVKWIVKPPLAGDRWPADRASVPAPSPLN
jgi:hypothetical protein